MMKYIVTLFSNKAKYGRLIVCTIGLLIAISIIFIFNNTILFYIVLTLIIIAIPLINKYNEQKENIALDMVIGLWFSLSIVPPNIILMLLTFIFFNIYDKTKPSIIKKLYIMNNTIFNIADDLIVGLMASVSTMICLKIFNFIINYI